jgi:multidrug efflux pump subunit AcrA (membrane-fusion protein)
MKKYMLFTTLALSVLILLASCGGAANDPTATPAAASADTIIAEAHLNPNRYQYLTFPLGGKVAEIIVEQGDQVRQGQVLASLVDRQQPQAALAAANLQVTLAQQDLDLLNRSAGPALAQAWLNYMDAQKNRALAQLAWDRLDQSSLQTDIDDARSDVTSRKTDLENAQADFDKYSDLANDNATRKSYESKLRTAQTDYDQAVQKMENLINGRDRVRATLDAALGAEAEAKRTYENSQNGPDTDKFAMMQARLDNAKAQQGAAQNVLDNYDLKAPFAGTVMEINVSANQLVGPDTWVIAIADTSQWFVDTSDLNELDVVKIEVGQKVEVTADALPGKTMTGLVDRIGATPKNLGTDVLYTIRIRLEDPDPLLRWGMTMEVTFIEAK